MLELEAVKLITIELFEIRKVFVTEETSPETCAPLEEMVTEILDHCILKVPFEDTRSPP